MQTDISITLQSPPFLALKSVAIADISLGLMH